MFKILVIEDNEPNLYLLRYVLEINGYEVLAARDGHEGLRRALDDNPDLILTDLRLPDMGGFELLERLGTRVPVVAVTAHAMVGDRERALQRGFSGYLEKPILPSHLIAQVQSFLSERTPAASPAGSATGSV